MNESIPLSRITPYDLCPTCGAYWDCEHRAVTEEVNLRSIGRFIADEFRKRPSNSLLDLFDVQGKDRPDGNGVWGNQ